MPSIDTQGNGKYREFFSVIECSCKISSCYIILKKNNRNLNLYDEILLIQATSRNEYVNSMEIEMAKEKVQTMSMTRC